MILHRYFAKRFLWTFAGVLFVFVMIIGFINVIEQMRRGASVDASFSDVLTLALLSVPQSIRQFEAREDALRGNSSTLAIGATGLWLRQGNEAGQTVIRAASADLSGTKLEDVTFLTFAADGSPIRRVEANQATLDDGAWRL